MLESLPYFCWIVIEVPLESIQWQANFSFRKSKTFQMVLNLFRLFQYLDNKEAMQILMFALHLLINPSAPYRCRTLTDPPLLTLTPVISGRTQGISHTNSQTVLSWSLLLASLLMNGSRKPLKVVLPHCLLWESCFSKSISRIPQTGNPSQCQKAVSCFSLHCTRAKPSCPSFRNRASHHSPWYFVIRNQSNSAWGYLNQLWFVNLWAFLFLFCL